jgi:ribokinase
MTDGARQPGSTSPADRKVVVVGSANLDHLVRVDQLPRPGETVLSSGLTMTEGGKGANQAVSLSRLGRSVAFLGCVGDDAAGRRLLASMAADDIDVRSVRSVPGTPTGAAFVFVDRNAENQIVVEPGANAALNPSDVASNSRLLRAAEATLAQLEVPLETVTAAAAVTEGLFVLNPAPARPLPSELLRNIDVLVPNRSELATLAGAQEAASLAALEDQARSLDLDLVVVTLGSDGALVVERRGGAHHVGAMDVPAVDTTGAGDTFCAAFVDRFTGRHDAVDAVRYAAAAAAITVMSPGAQPRTLSQGRVQQMLREGRDSGASAAAGDGHRAATPTTRDAFSPASSAASIDPPPGAEAHQRPEAGARGGSDHAP